jgi:DNA processing protein
VVVAARRRSGALLTARAAADLGREVGAVPGQITAPLAEGPHLLLRGGAHLIAGPQDVFDALFAAGGRPSPSPQPSLEPQLQRLLDALADGHDTAECFEIARMDPDRGLAALASLELGGRIRRQQGGRFSAVPGTGG